MVGSNSNLLRHSQWINFPTPSCLVLYSFYASLLHFPIMWLTVLSLSSHNLHLAFCCILWQFCARFSFYFKVYLYYPCPYLLVCNLTSLSIEIFIQLFYSPFLFSSFRCFLFVILLLLVLADVISLSFLFLIYSKNLCIDASMQSSMLIIPLSLSFLDIYYVYVIS